MNIVKSGKQCSNSTSNLHFFLSPFDGFWCLLFLQRFTNNGWLMWQRATHVMCRLYVRFFFLWCSTSNKKIRLTSHIVDTPPWCGNLCSSFKSIVHWMHLYRSPEWLIAASATAAAAVSYIYSDKWNNQLIPYLRSHLKRQRALNSFIYLFEWICTRKCIYKSHLIIIISYNQYKYLFWWCIFCKCCCYCRS